MLIAKRSSNGRTVFVPKNKMNRNSAAIIADPVTHTAVQTRVLYKCPFCSFKTNRPNISHHLRYHQQREKRKQNETKAETTVADQFCIHECELCTFQTVDLEELKDHVNIHM